MIIIIIIYNCFFEASLKSFLMLNTVLACTLSLAAESNNENVYSYASPCEAVQPQSEVLKKLQQNIQQLPEQTAHFVEAFWAKTKKIGTPQIESLNENEDRMIFLYRGAKHNARLIGGPSNDHEWLTRLPHTDIWFKESIVKNSFIGSYSFAIDSPNIDGYLSHYCAHLDTKLKESRNQRRSILQVQKLDPHNTKLFLDTENSTLRNENIVALKNTPEYINPKAYPHIQAPKLKTYNLHSHLMQNDRAIKIYQSTKLDPNQDYITAIFFDGEQYADLLNVPKALDILVQQHQLPPIQAVFITHPSDAIRPKELTPNDEYSEFFAKEFLPWLDQHIQRDPKKTVLLGSSLGGLSSAYLALEYPHEVSHVVPLSGSFWWQQSSTDQPNGMSKIIREK